jgi:predicted metal-binding membrane protein
MSVFMTQASTSGLPAPRPVRLAMVSLGLLILAGWAALVFEAMRAGEGGLVAAICRPLGLGEGGRDALARYGDAVFVWIAMVLAMMLPTAVSMVLAFAERLSGPARQTGLALLSLLAGYCALWVVVAAGASALQMLFDLGLARAALPDRAAAILAGTAIGFAGLYQFSTLKRASLAACRHPFPADQPLPGGPFGAFRLGLRQGIHCLGCCGAMMAMMLVAGTMNLLWMLAFAVIMTVEKLVPDDRLPRAIGGVMLALGAVLAVSSVGWATVLAWIAAR